MKASSSRHRHGGIWGTRLGKRGHVLLKKKEHVLWKKRHVLENKGEPSLVGTNFNPPVTLLLTLTTACYILSMAILPPTAATAAKRSEYLNIEDLGFSLIIPVCLSKNSCRRRSLVARCVDRMP